MNRINQNEEMTKITFRISVAEKEALLKYADENDITISQIIRKILKSYIKQKIQKDK